MARIKLTGYANAKVIEDIFASAIVDDAYVDEVGPDAIYIIADVGIDFENPRDFAWVKEVIESTLRDYHQENVLVTLDKPSK